MKEYFLIALALLICGTGESLGDYIHTQLFEVSHENTTEKQPELAHSRFNDINRGYQGSQ